MDSSVFVHERAIVEPGARLGAGSRIWAFAHILGGAVVGRDCNVCDHVFIENEVVIGDRVTLKCGVQVWDGVRLDDDVFVGPNVTFTNDVFPRSKSKTFKPARTHVKTGASLGANCTVLAGLVVGQHAMIGAGAVVTKDVPPYAIVVGNPAAIMGYVNDAKDDREGGRDAVQSNEALQVRGVKLIDFPFIRDLRGDLAYAEVNKELPFVPQRIFTVFNVPTRKVRGEHAHRTLHELLVCLTGSVSVMVDDGVARDTIVLRSPTKALHLQPMVWAAQYQYSRDATVLVLASDVYKSDDYIRDYDAFLLELKRAAPVRRGALST